MTYGKWRQIPLEGMEVVPMQTDVERLGELAAVIKHDEGAIESEELASFVLALADMGAARVNTVGAESYDTGSGQRFQALTPGELVQGFLEEISDAQNYLAMLAIKALALYRVLDD